MLSSFTPLARSWCIWRVCKVVSMSSGIYRFPLQMINHDELYSASHSYSPPLSDVNKDVISHIVIKTSYCDPLSPENKWFKLPHDKSKNTIWSTSESGKKQRVLKICTIRCVYISQQEDNCAKAKDPAITAYEVISQGPSIGESDPWPSRSYGWFGMQPSDNMQQYKPLHVMHK